MCTWSCCWLLLCFCISASHTTFTYIVTQTPGLIHVSVGNPVELKCAFDYPVNYCYSTTWYKVNLRTGELTPTSLGSSSITEHDKKTCILKIKNVSLKDSGLYYCTSQHSSIIVMGNGTEVIVTDHSEPKLSILYSPDDTSAVPLQCVVTGVAPSQVRMFWMISQKKRAGWIESAWTNNTDSGTLLTRGHLSVSAEEWARDDEIQCTVEHNGKNISKTLIKWGSNSTCGPLLHVGSGAAVFIIALAVIFAYSCRGLATDQHTMNTEVVYEILDPHLCKN